MLADHPAIVADEVRLSTLVFLAHPVHVTGAVVLPAYATLILAVHHLALCAPTRLFDLFDSPSVRLQQGLGAFLAAWGNHDFVSPSEEDAAAHQMVRAQVFAFAYLTAKLVRRFGGNSADGTVEDALFVNHLHLHVFRGH